MAGSREVDRLRDEARKANRRAGSKLSRFRREQGIKHTGGIDPRVGADRIGRMNSIQLRSYINRVEEFTNRRVQFVADSKGNPVDRRVYDFYKWNEKRVNRQRRKFLSEVGDIQLPMGDMTVGDWVGMFGQSENKRHMLTNSQTREVNRKPSDFTSEENIRKITASLSREIGQESRRIKDWRQQAEEMLSTFNSKLADKFRKLSDKQFSVLWSGTGFVNSVASVYEMIKNDLSFGNVIDNENSIMDELIDWAATI